MSAVLASRFRLRCRWSVTTSPSLWKFSQLILIGWFVNSIAWLRLGDAYRAYALSEDSDKKFSWSLGTVFAERMVDTKS